MKLDQASCRREEGPKGVQGHLWDTDALGLSADAVVLLGTAVDNPSWKRLFKELPTCLDRVHDLLWDTARCEHQSLPSPCLSRETDCVACSTRWQLYLELRTPGSQYQVARVSVLLSSLLRKARPLGSGGREVGDVALASSLSLLGPGRNPALDRPTHGFPGNREDYF